MVLSRLQKDKTNEFSSEIDVSIREDYQTGTADIPHWKIEIIRIEKGTKIAIHDLWLKWGYRQDPTDSGSVVWIAEDGPLASEVTLTADDIGRLDAVNVFMDAQRWQQVGTAGTGSNAVQTLSEGAHVEFEEDEIEAFDEDKTINFYAMGQNATDLAATTIILANYTLTRRSRVFADDFSEYAIGTNWEETVPISE